MMSFRRWQRDFRMKDCILPRFLRAQGNQEYPALFFSRNLGTGLQG
jgi:hypothetical protein